MVARVGEGPRDGQADPPVAPVTRTAAARSLRSSRPLGRCPSNASGLPMVTRAGRVVSWTLWRGRGSPPTRRHGRVFGDHRPQSAALDQSARMRRYFVDDGHPHRLLHHRGRCQRPAAMGGGRWRGGAALLRGGVLANASVPARGGSVGTVTPYVDPTPDHHDGPPERPLGTGCPRRRSGGPRSRRWPTSAGRAGGSRPRPIPWPGALRHISPRIRPATCSSVAPERRGHAGRSRGWRRGGWRTRPSAVSQVPVARLEGLGHRGDDPDLPGPSSTR